MPLACAASSASAISMAEREQGLDVQRAARDAVLQSHALEKLHGDEGVAFVLADVVNGADVGMVQRGGGLGFALETAQRLRVSGDVVGKKFQRDEAVQARVFGLVDNAHAAAAELFDDAVVRDGLADHGRANGRRAGVGGQRIYRCPYRVTS